MQHQIHHLQDFISEEKVVLDEEVLLLMKLLGLHSLKLGPFLVFSHHSLEFAQQEPVELHPFEHSVKVVNSLGFEEAFALLSDKRIEFISDFLESRETGVDLLHEKVHLCVLGWLVVVVL